MKKYIKNHEKYILSKLISYENLEKYKTFHIQQIKWLQHERQIHLYILMFTSILLITNIIIMYITSIALLIFTTIILFILEFFYITHYYLLENTVQKWYKISNTFEKKINGININVIRD